MQAMLKAVRRALLVVAAALTLTTPALAQFGSPGYRFLEAVRARDYNAANQMLADSSTVINTREVQSGDTALLIVIERRDLPWLNMLLSRGADANIANRDGESPLRRVVQLGWAEAVPYLSTHGARINDSGSSGETALHIAVQRRDIAMVRALVAAGANPDLSDNITGKTPRDLAMEDRRTPAILAALDERPTAPPRPVAGPN